MRRKRRRLRRRRQKSSIFSFLSSFLALAVLAGGAYGIINFQDEILDMAALNTSSLNIPSDGPLMSESEEDNLLIQKVESHILLPRGEVPSIITIKDAAALREKNDFYEFSNDGDKVLIFEDSLTMIIYSPRQDKIINAGPFLAQSN